MINRMNLEVVANRHKNLISCYQIIITKKQDKFILWNHPRLGIGDSMVAVISEDGARAWVSGTFIGNNALMVEAILKDLGIFGEIIKENQKIYWSFEVDFLN